MPASNRYVFPPFSVKVPVPGVGSVDILLVKTISFTIRSIRVFTPEL